MWSVGRLCVHGVFSRRMVHREVLEVRSDYKRSFLAVVEKPSLW